jgi:hypothetical protein
MIRLEIEASSPEHLRALMADLFNGVRGNTPETVQPNFAAASAERVTARGQDFDANGMAQERNVESPGETLRRGPGRPRKNPKVEPITIDGTATEVKAPPADIGTADPSPAIIVPDDEPVAETSAAETAPATPPPFLALEPLKDAYTLDEVRTLAMAYVRAMVVDAKGNTDRDAARGVLKGLLGAFGVEGVGGLDDGQRLSMVKLIHHLAPFGRTPPAAETFAGIVASFGG